MGKKNTILPPNKLSIEELPLDDSKNLVLIEHPLICAESPKFMTVCKCIFCKININMKIFEEFGDLKNGEMERK